MIVLALSALLAAPAPAPRPLADDFHWKKKLASGQTIHIEGINGSVRATGSSGSEVEVSAIKKARRGNPDLVKIEVVEGSDGVTICAVWPNKRGETGHCDDHHHDEGNNKETDDVSVEFTIAVPAGIKFDGSTVNGEVSAIGLDEDATVSTVNGSAEVSTKGRAHATTVNGQVRATMGKALDSDADFSTVNGGITLTMPADLACEIRAGTVNGSIDSDFPITMSGKMSPTSLRGSIGSGGHLLKLSTVNGSIRLRKS